MKLYSIAKRFRIDNPKKFRLSEHDPAECYGLTVDKSEPKALLNEGIERLSDLQERLYADGRWSVLIVLQAMDAAGKDSIIKHMLSGINPQGCEVHSFKPPNEEDLQHNFLWRVSQRLPANGRIGIFNRSHYEEVLAVRMHREFLERQHLPKEFIGKDPAIFAPVTQPDGKSSVIARKEMLEKAKRHAVPVIDFNGTLFVGFEEGEMSSFLKTQKPG